MKEIVSRILTGELVFGEDRAPLSFSCDEILCESAPDKLLYGSFTIYCREEVHAYVISEDLRLCLKTGEFFGKNCEIPYMVDTHGMPHGTKQSGVLSIISDHGEYELPYSIVVSGKQPDSSLGEIRNLFHFANLAKSDWEEAKELFYSPAFEHVLGGTDVAYLPAYWGFSACPGNSQNMESFLEDTRKKTRPSYCAETESIELVLPRKSMRKHVKIVREGWGYTELHVSCTGDFLEVEQEMLTEEDFSGNVAQLPYIIQRNVLMPGENRGELIICDRLDEIRIPVCVNVPRREAVLSAHYDLCRLMQCYLDYRVGRMDVEEFSSECGRIVENVLAVNPDDLKYRLYQAQLLLLEKRQDEAKAILDRIAVLADEQGVPVAEEAYRLYLQQLCTTDEEQCRRYAEHVEELFHREPDNWRLAWTYMSMDENFVHNERKKWRLLKEQYEEYHNASPIMFLEAYQILLQDVKRLDTLESFELAVLRFALRRSLMTKELKERFALLSMEIHSFSAEMCELLQQCYETEESTVLLEAICLHMIRGNLSGPGYFGWYSKAVAAEMRISRLYEFYVMSAPLDYRDTLPRIVLMYFAYRSPLNAERNAFLYANVLRHKNDYQEICEQYMPVITEFAKEQLLEGCIDSNLAYIYKKLFAGKKTEEIYSDAYTELLFVEQIVVKKEQLVNLVLVYEHLKEERIYPLEHGQVCVPLYGERFSILLEDAWGNRYTDKKLYERHPLLRDKADVKRLLALKEPRPGSMLVVAEQSGDTPSVSEENRGILAALAENEDITDDYRLRIWIALAEYYFDTDDIAPLDILLRRFEPQGMESLDRERCIRIMVARGMYEEAFEWICRCGSEGVDTKILVRLCDRLLVRTDQEYRPELLKLCQGILAKGRYDEEILNYLLRYGMGIMKQRKELWLAADSFGLDVQNLLESMMLQILFTDADIPEKTAIYLEHLSGGVGAELERAYVASLCFDYFIRDKETDDKVFERVGQLYRLEEELQTVCVLAWLKNAAVHIAQRELSEAEKELCREFLELMHGFGIFLPFFTAFASIDSHCRLQSARSFIEYHGREDSRVILHYVMDNGNELPEDYRREEMPHVYGGIFVRSFTLFYGEKIHYYITEEDGRNEKLTRSSTLEYVDSEHSGGEDRFSALNNISIAKEMDDEITFLKLFEDYDRLCCMTEGLFLPASAIREKRE